MTRWQRNRADRSRSDGTLGQIWNNDLPSLPMRQLTQIPLRALLQANRPVHSPQESALRENTPPPFPLLCCGWINIKHSSSDSSDASTALSPQWWGDAIWQALEILIQAQILIGWVCRSDFLSWWGMLIPCNSLVSATLAAGNDTVVSALLDPSFPSLCSVPPTPSTRTSVSVSGMQKWKVFISTRCAALTVWLKKSCKCGQQ